MRAHGAWFRIWLMIRGWWIVITSRRDGVSCVEAEKGEEGGLYTESRLRLDMLSKHLKK